MKACSKRETLLTTFIRYARDLGRDDPAQIWVDLCLNRPQAKADCQLFLTEYLRNSTELSYDTDGNDVRTRTIHSASSMDLVWKDLVGHANADILKKKRDEDPQNAHIWTVRYSSAKQGKLFGPVSQITYVRRSCSSVYHLLASNGFHL